jgi:hypothetical protein
MNKVNPIMKIDLDKPRSIKFDLNAMVYLEETTGKSLQEIYNGQAPSMSSLRAILWACLIHEDPALTLEQVGSLVSMENMAEVSAKIAEALNAALPEGKGDTESDPLGGQTGSASGPSGTITLD